MLDEALRRHQHAPEAAEQRCQDCADQPHVVIRRQPADHRAFFVIPHPLADQREVVDQVAMGDHHALRLAGGARCVLQERDVRRRDIGRLERRVKRLRGVEIEQRDVRGRRILQQFRAAREIVAGGQDRLRTRALDDADDAARVLPVARRIRGHGDRARIQAAEKARDVVETRPAQQQHALADADRLPLQQQRDAARGSVELGERDRLPLFVVGLTAQEQIRDFLAARRRAHAQQLVDRLRQIGGGHDVIRQEMKPTIVVVAFGGRRRGARAGRPMGRSARKPPAPACAPTRRAGTGRSFAPCFSGAARGTTFALRAA